MTYDGGRFSHRYLLRDSWLATLKLRCNHIGDQAAEKLRVVTAAARRGPEEAGDATGAEAGVAGAEAAGAGSERGEGERPQRLESLAPLAMELHEPTPKRPYEYPRPIGKYGGSDLQSAAARRAAAAARPSSAPAAQHSTAQRLMEGDERRLAALRERKRALCEQSARAAQVHRCARAIASQPACVSREGKSKKGKAEAPLTAAEWAALSDACGGARPMLDALEDLIASTLAPLVRLGSAQEVQVS